MDGGFATGGCTHFGVRSEIPPQSVRWRCPSSQLPFHLRQDLRRLSATDRDGWRDDHVHLLVEYQGGVTNLVNNLKACPMPSAAQRRPTSKRYWKGVLRSSCFSSSCGGAPISPSHNYIRSNVETSLETRTATVAPTLNGGLVTACGSWPASLSRTAAALTTRPLDFFNHLWYQIGVWRHGQRWWWCRSKSALRNWCGRFGALAWFLAFRAGLQFGQPLARILACSSVTSSAGCPSRSKRTAPPSAAFDSWTGRYARSARASRPKGQAPGGVQSRTR